MNKGLKTALILGASGLTGKFCLNLILDSPCYESVIILVRKEIDIKHPKLKQAVVDFDYTAPMEKLYAGIDDVFCCLGTNVKKSGSQSAFRRVDFHIPTEAANLASNNGVKQFLAISVSGANNHSSNVYLRIKGEMEKGVTQFGFKSIHFFRPGLLMDENASISNKDSVPNIFHRFVLAFSGKSKSNHRIIEHSVLAKAMVNAANLGNEGESRYSTSQIISLAKKDIDCSHKE